MYCPAEFREIDPEILQRAIAKYPLAALITIGTHGIEASHIPLLHYKTGETHGVLRGHIARANQQWREYVPDSEALAIFRGPQHYITPAWYASKKEHGKVVPTWNYVTVHARGKLTFTTSREWLLANVRALTESQETANDPPWRVSDAPPDYIDKLLGAIVGIELNITQLEGKWKVSQNRPAADRDGVIASLEPLPSDEAREMARIIKGTARI